MKYRHLYTQYSRKLQEQKLYRTLPQEKDILRNHDFSHNDYLGLSQRFEALSQGFQIAQQYGVGSTGSRLLAGNIPIMADFEHRIAIDKNTEKALLFPTGYQANSTVLSQLIHYRTLGSKVLLLFDKYNHASLYHAFQYNHVVHKRYNHNNIDHLTSILEQYATQYQYIFLVVESVYGMDGDIAPLEQYIKLCKEYNIFLYIDEAHATGMFGKRGYGLTSELDFNGISYCIMGTLSKALGGMGAYIASHKEVIDYLITTCSGFIYSTSLSPFLVGAMFENWKYIEHLHKEREQIQAIACYLREGIQECGFSTSHSSSHIVPLLHNDIDYIQGLYKKLLEHGIKTAYIRPPTAPTPRLRLACTIHHNKKDIDTLITLIKSYR